VVIYAPLVAACSGIALAYLFYGRGRQLPGRLAKHLPLMYHFSRNKWYVDEIYNFLFLRRAFHMGTLFWIRGDGGLIDRFGPDGVTKLSLTLSRLSSRLQTGYVYHYAFAMIIGLLIMVSWAFIEVNRGDNIPTPSQLGDHP
jgi:NADH-quinone oxidoreductase subunit L